MALEDIKYIIVEDEEFGAEEIARIHNIEMDFCGVVDKKVAEEHNFGNLIVLTSDNFGIMLQKIKRDVSFCLIPCWYYPESMVLTGKTRIYTFLLGVARTIANLITIFTGKFGHPIYFTVRVIK